MFGRTGYEATAQIGVVAGGVLFAAAGVWLALRRRPR
jgi:LPXTG-motif cell wall-anchored protein